MSYGVFHAQTCMIMRTSPPGYTCYVKYSVKNVAVSVTIYMEMEQVLHHYMYVHRNYIITV